MATGLQFGLTNEPTPQETYAEICQDPIKDFIDFAQSELKLGLIEFPEDLPFSMDDAASIWPLKQASGWGGLAAIEPENMSGLIESVMMQVAEEARITYTLATTVAPRGQDFVPIVVGQPVTLLEYIVPIGYNFWINAGALNLFPSTANELNYVWRIFVNGEDVLNKGIPTPPPGRPVQSPNPFVLGRTKRDQPCAKPGSTVLISVDAIANLGASDQVSATLFGTLEPA